MISFTAVFEITEEHGCPFYKVDELFTLTNQALLLPMGKPACLLLSRELTTLLFKLIPLDKQDLAGQGENVYTCGGCTGLIKFRLSTAVPENGRKETDKREEIEEEKEEVVISGQLGHLSPAEVLQIFHMHQKTGKLLLELEDGSGQVIFRNGEILSARYNKLKNQEAVHKIISLRQGQFSFTPGLSASLKKARKIGDFMRILLKG